MKRITTLLFVFFIIFQAQTQGTQHWKIDLDTLEHQLIQKDYLFTKISKIKFRNKIKLLKNKSLDSTLQFWELSTLLHNFNIPSLQLQDTEFKCFPLEIKQFSEGFYIVGIHPDYSTFLGYQLTKINGFTINKMLQKTTSIKHLNSYSFLKYHHFLKKDSLRLSLISDKDKKVEISLSLTKFDADELIRIIPKKEAFYLRKSSDWFWQYGINFGQQVYFKYNVGLSNEFLQQEKDSLKISAIRLAQNYKLPLQTIYDAPTFTDFTKKLFEKFKKRRYKKLFIDFRNNQTGNVKAFDDFIKKLKKTKRINKKNRLYLFIDKTISSSVMETILALKKRVHITIIGESVHGIACSSDNINYFYLPNSAFKIYFPRKYFETITIKPDVLVSTSFKNYKNGIDPILQKALDL